VVLLLHTAPGRGLVRQALEKAAGRALGGPVTIGGIDYRLWAGTVTVTRVSATRAGLDLSVERAELGVGPLSGLRARVVSPRVVVTSLDRDQPEATEGSARPWTFLARLAQVAVEGGSIELRDRNAQPWLQLQGLEGQLVRASGTSRGQLRVSRGSVGWPGGGLRVEPVSIEADFEIGKDGGALQVTRAHFVTGETRLEASGRLDRLFPITARLEAQGTVDARLFRRLRPELEMEGRLDGRLSFTHNAAGGLGSLLVETPAVSVLDLGPWKGRVQARLEGRRLVVQSAEFEGYDGRVSASGPVLLWDGRTELDVRATGVDVAAFARTFAGFRPPISSRADGALRLTLDNWDLQSLRGQGQLGFRPAERTGWPVSGPASLALVGRRLDFSSAALHARDARLAMRGSLGFDKRLGLEYRFDLPRVQGLADLLADAGMKMAAVAVGGALAAEGSVEGLLPDWRATAGLTSDGLRVDDVRVGLSGALRLSSAGIEIESLACRGAEAEAEASGFVPIDPARRWDVRGRIASLSLAESLARRGLPVPATASGSFVVSGPAGAPEARFSLQASAQPVLPGAIPNAAVESAPADSTKLAAPAVPVGAVRERANIHVSGVVSRARVVLETAEADLGGGRASATGTWDVDSGRIEGRLTASAVAIERLPWLPPAMTGLASTLSADLQVAGRAVKPEGQAQLRFAGNSWRGQALPAFDLQAVSDGEKLRVSGHAAGRSLLEGQLALAGQWPLHLDVDVAALPLTELLRTLPAAAAQDAVALEGRLAVDLPLAAPAQARYAADVSALQLSLDRVWRSGPFRARGSLEDLVVEDFVLAAGESRLSVSGDLGPAPASGLAVEGALPLSDIRRLLADLDLAGDSRIALQLSGRLDGPDISGRVELRDVSGRLGRVAFDGVQVRAAARKGVLTLEQATGRLAGGVVTASGGFPFGPGTRGTPRQLAFDAKGLDLGSLLPTPPGAPRLSTAIDVSARITASQPSLAAITAEGELTQATLTAGSQLLELEEPVPWRFAARRLEPLVARLRGSGGRLVVEASFDASATPARLTGSVSGETDLALLNPLFAQVGTLSGPARLDLAFTRGPGGLELQGEARTDGGRLALKTPPLVVSNLKGAVRANGTSFELADWTGEVGDGRLDASGRLRLAEGGLELDLSLKAEQVPLSYPEGMHSRFTGQVRLAGRDSRFRLSGDVKVQRALYQRQTDRSSQVIDSVAAELAALDQKGSPLERVQLDVRVTLEDGLRVENAQAALAVDGGFVVGGDILTPEVSGTLTLREGGSLRLGRARLRLGDGRVELAGYPARPPNLDVSGVTQVSGVQIEAALTGPLDDFRMDLSSPNHPDLTQGDLATLILTGRTASAAASDKGAVLAEELAVVLGEALDRQLGGAVFVDVSPDDSLVALDQADPTQRFNIGVPVGDRLYVIYSNALDRSAQRLVLDIRPGFGLRLRLIGEEDGSKTIEVSQRLDLNLWSRGAATGREKPASVRVRQLRIEGVPAEEVRRLESRLDLAPGDEFDFFKGETAAGRLRETLMADGFLLALVEQNETPASTGRVDVVVRVERGPRLSIAWTGDDPGGRLRERARKGWEPGRPVVEAVFARARTLRRELQAMGYFGASVVAEVEERPGEAKIVFDVRCGAPGRGVDIRYEGNRSLPAASLDAALPGSQTPELFALIEAESRDRLSAALRLPYARAGFLEARVGSPRTDFDPRSGRLRVTIPIEEGQRARVVGLELPEAVREPGAPPLVLGLAVGEPFRIDAYVADRGRLGAWYRAQGYPEARVVGVLEPVSGGLRVRFAAEPGPRPTLREVRVEGTGKTRRGVVDGALTLGPGDRVEPRALSESREHLAETRVFRGIDLRTEPTDDPATRDLVVGLVERPDLSLEYALRYTTSGSGEVGGAPSNPEGGRLQAGAAIEVPNPFGWAHRYRIYGMLGSERTTYGVSFDAATFFGRRWRTQLFLYSDEDFKNQDLPGYAQWIRGTAFQQTQRWRHEIAEGRWRDSPRLQWGYAFKRVRYTDVETLQSREGDRAGPTSSLIGDTRDSVTDPHRGLFWSLGLDANLRALGSDENYLKLYGQLFAYVPLGEHVVWASGLRLGAAPGSNLALLIEGRFKAGGATTVRGFNENSLGPQTAEGVAFGGQASFVFNQELRFPIWSRLQGGVFFDAGNVWGLVRNLDLGDLRHSLGAGLRFMFPFGPVRLDWAHVLDAREGEKRSRVVFTLGHAF
jgi:outer membrane protein assembly complex protein YaeT